MNIDYHIAFDSNFYSAPNTLVGELVEVRSTPTTVEIFHRGGRVRITRTRDTSMARPSPSRSIVPRAIRRIWSGRLRDGELGRHDRPVHGAVV